MTSLNILTKINSSKLKIIKVLAIIILIFSVGIKFYNLSDKAHNADEVRGLYRLSGYNREEIINKAFNGNIIGVSDLQLLQIPTADKKFGDAMESLSGNPEHTPLYYLIARFWMQITQKPISARVTSVVISLLIFPSLYWLCLELFEKPLFGWISIILMALSPYHILLSQGAREYSLWTLMTVLGSAALLKAIRVKTTKSWIVYTLTLILGFYSHLFFTLVALAHGLYLVCIDRFRFTKTFIAYIWSSVVGVLAFLPWIMVTVNNLEEIENKTSWVRSANLSIQQISRFFYGNLGNVFIDFNDSTRLEKLFDILVFAICLYSLYLLIKETSIKTWLLIVLFIVIISAAQILPDLILQGKRSSQARYFIPCYVAIQLAVTYFIASYLNYKQVWKQYLGTIVLSFFILTGMLSSVFIANANDWDYLDQGKTANALNLELAPYINSADKSIILSETTHSFILGLSYLVDKDVKFQLVEDKNLTQWNQKIDLARLDNEFANIFVYLPDRQFMDFLDRHGDYQREDVFNNKIYRMKKK